MDKFSTHKISCDQLLILLDNTIKTDIQDKYETFNNIRKGLYSYDQCESLGDVFQGVITLLNDRNIISCMTFPYIYDILDFILIRPDEVRSAIPIYRILRLSDEFINKLLYKSLRPKVDMRPYLKCYSITPKYLPMAFLHVDIQHYSGDNYYLSNMEPNKIYTNCAIPVIRYQTGMSGYYTCGEYKEGYCGTFYYFEPDSEYMLFSPIVLTTTNKITACLILGMDINFIVNILLGSKGKWMVGEYPNLLKDGYPNHMGFNVSGTTKYEQWYNVVVGFFNGTINSDIHYHYMYAGEDDFDQPLCKLAKSKGISSIILQRMTGETRVVTEVFDTRERIDSFDNLYLPKIY